MMIRSLAIVCLAALAWRAVFGQETAAPPAFEVASVKPSTEQDRVIGMFTYPGGRVTAANYTLKMLIHEAYAIEDYKILGCPHWAETERYNLEAKPAASSTLSQWVPANFKTPPNAEMRRMLQTLLAERFQLKLHREPKKEAIYALVVARGGPRLSEPKDTAQQPFVVFLPHGLRGQNATMDLLVDRLATILGRPVLNRTGVRGTFDFLIDYPADDPGTDVEGRLLSALPEQVGLKFETQPGTVEVVVIDHAQKLSAN
jgi:uncharacterized protein (TIGR03435 family)